MNLCPKQTSARKVEDILLRYHHTELAEIHLEHAKAHQKAWSTTEMYLRRHVLQNRENPANEH